MTGECAEVSLNGLFVSVGILILGAAVWFALAPVRRTLEAEVA